MKNYQKVIGTVFCAITLSAAVATPALASSTARQNSWIEWEGDRFRPPLAGNISGRSWVQTRSGSGSTASNGIRARVVIQNRNSNGNLISTTTGTWQQATASSGNVLARGTERTSNVTGASRRGTVTASAERRATASSNWGNGFSAATTWN